MRHVARPMTGWVAALLLAAVPSAWATLVPTPGALVTGADDRPWWALPGEYAEAALFSDFTYDVSPAYRALRPFTQGRPGLFALLRTCGEPIEGSVVHARTWAFLDALRGLGLISAGRANVDYLTWFTLPADSGGWRFEGTYHAEVYGWDAGTNRLVTVGGEHGERARVTWRKEAGPPGPPEAGLGPPDSGAGANPLPWAVGPQ